MGYVVTNKWLKAGYAEALRGMLIDPAQAETESVIDFGHARAFFPDADVFPNVVVARRPDGSAALDTLTVAVPPRETLPDEQLGAAVTAASFPLLRTALGREGWTLEPKPVMDLLAKIRRTGIPLVEFAGVKPLYGIKTGLNEAFLIDTPTRDRLVAEDAASGEIIKPYLRGQDVQRWSADWAGLWMIFTRRGIDIGRYPAILAHLQQFRSALEPRPLGWTSTAGEEWPGRKPGSYPWYEVQDPIDYWREFEKPKIIYPDITWSTSFALDVAGLYMNNTTYFLPSGDEWLLAVLNSPAGWWLSWRGAQRGKDDALRYFNTFLENYPIPARPSQDNDVHKISALSQKVRHARGTIADWLRIEFGVDRAGRGLETVERLDADAFAGAVRAVLPRRRSLSAAEIARLKREHADTIQPARHAATEARRLEQKVSDLVNKAYGLTPDDVRLMWATAPPRMPLAAPPLPPDV